VKNQSGFTVVELLICMASIAAAGGVIWIVCHFIAKFW
jgi:hypothetical protein